MSRTRINLGIEYLGHQGISKPCAAVVIRLIQCGVSIRQARLLSCNNSHAFLLSVGPGDPPDLIAVRTGFASGYGGEGPRTLSYVLSLLEAHHVDIEEYEVDQLFLNRLDEAALLEKDLTKLGSASPVRPMRWVDYVYESHDEQRRNGELWDHFDPVIPFSLIDRRIIDLAISFWENPDEKLLTGYRRLEDFVRSRTGLEEHGSKLFSQAFIGSNSKLFWKDIGESEQIRHNLFTGGFMAFRNPRAHRQPLHSENEQLSEFLLLNMLFKLEHEASMRPEPLTT